MLTAGLTLGHVLTHGQLGHVFLPRRANGRGSAVHYERLQVLGDTERGDRRLKVVIGRASPSL